METVGQPRIKQIGEQAHADFEEALKLDPQNFSALYSYAIYEGYRPGGAGSPEGAVCAPGCLAHIKALLALADGDTWRRPESLSSCRKIIAGRSVRETSPRT